MSGFVAGACDGANQKITDHLRGMSKILAHRGENETVTNLSDSCVAITRYWAERGYKVDVHNTSDSGIVLDGLISNTESLRSEVGTGVDATPAETILKGYERFGDLWLAKIAGSFTLMIVNRLSGDVVLARDRFGHRPLYFGIFNGSVWVASEIKALRAAPGYESSPNPEALYSSIAYGVTPGPKTLFNNVYKVVPGFVFKINPGGNYTTTDYFSPTAEPRFQLTLEEAKEEIISNLKASIGRYVQACPGVCTTLSGGVDSALIAHLATELAGDSVTALGFGADGWPADESAVARDIAARIGIHFDRAFVPADGDLLGPLRRVVSSLEEPSRFENAMALEILAQQAPQGCTAIMTGEGADSMLGSQDHVNAGRIARINRIPGVFRAMLNTIPLRKMPIRQFQTLANYLDWSSVEDYYLKTMANCCDLVSGSDGPPRIEILDMLSEPLTNWPAEAHQILAIFRYSSHCWIERMEKIAASAGLECFHPFETNDMLQLGLELPRSLLYSNGITKPAVRSLAADILGDQSANLQKKQLAAPMQLWLNESAQLRDAVLELKAPGSRIRDYLDHSAIDRYLDIYERDGATSESVTVHIFRMLTFEIWLDLFQ